MLNMIFKSVGIYVDVVNIHYYPSIQHVSEDVINEGLEHGRTTDQSKQNHQVFVVSCASGKGCFPFVTLSEANKIVCAAY